MKTIVCLPAVSGCSPAHQIVDPAIAVIVNTMPQLCGPMWRPNRVRLTRDPPRDRSPFTRFFKVPVEFGVLTAGVVFDASALDWPVRDRNPDYAKILTPLLDDAVADAKGDFVSAVKSVIRVRNRDLQELPRLTPERRPLHQGFVSGARTAADKSVPASQ